MLFNSWVFVAFFLAVYLVYLRLDQNKQNWLLLVASYVFYSFWDIRFLLLIIISTIVHYYCGRGIYETQSPKDKKQFLHIGVIVSLGILCVFKYFDFFLSNFLFVFRQFGLRPSISTLGIILPIGISFYTFQAISYTADIYSGKAVPCKRFRDFALYVTFFPQLVAGPIERATHLLGQIIKPRALSWEYIQKGAWLVLQGYFLKVFVADNASLIVDQAFSTRNLTGAIALLGIYAFAFQIYGDFAGYSRIARGICNLMGFDLVVNFKCPYLAINPRDFWKRWHISLSTWLRDYLYIPLGGNRCGISRTYTNLMITMLLGGLWHGAAWKFILWGLYHGVALVIYHLLTDFTKTPTANSGFLRPFKILVFFQVTCFGWLIFRCHSIKQIWTFPEAILNGLSFAKEDFHTLYMLLILVVPVVILDLAEEYANPVARLFDRFKATNPNLPVRVRVSAYFLTGLCMMTLIYLCGYRGGTEFIYFQF